MRLLRTRIDRRRLASAVGIVLMLAVRPAFASEESQLSGQDRQFLFWATDGAMADAALSRLAAQKAQAPAVKAFAQQALGELERYVAALHDLEHAVGMSPPARTVKEDRDLHDNLAATRGAEFDHLFMATMIGDTRKMIDLYNQEAITGRNPDVLSLVSKLLPRLHQLDEQARRVDLALPKTAPLMSPSGTVATHRASPGPM